MLQRLRLKIYYLYDPPFLSRDISKTSKNLSVVLYLTRLSPWHYRTFDPSWDSRIEIRPGEYCGGVTWHCTWSTRRRINIAVLATCTLSLVVKCQSTNASPFALPPFDGCTALPPLYNIPRGLRAKNLYLTSKEDKRDMQRQLSLIV